MQGAQTSATFELDAEVHFRAFLDNTPKEPVNKAGALMIEAGEAIDTFGYNPPPDVVLVPGMGAGDVQLDVNATIAPKGEPATAELERRGEGDPHRARLEAPDP